MSSCPNVGQVSRITSILFEETRLIGGVPNGPVISNNDTTDPFEHTMEIPPDIPHVERVRIKLVNTAECGIDSNGVFYGGDFQVSRNDIYADAWQGSLTSAQITTIQNAISLTSTPNEDFIELGITEIANVGAQFFQIVLPYKEVNIVPPGGTVSEDIISINATASTFPQFYVTVDQTNNRFIINGGDVGGDPAVISLQDIAPSFRSVTLDAQVTPTQLIIHSEEDLNNADLLTITDQWNTFGGLIPVGALQADYYADVTTTSLTFTVTRKHTGFLQGNIGEIVGIPTSDFTLFRITSTGGNLPSPGARLEITYPGNNTIRQFALVVIRQLGVRFSILVNAYGSGDRVRITMSQPFSLMVEMNFTATTRLGDIANFFAQSALSPYLGFDFSNTSYSYLDLLATNLTHSYSESNPPNGSVSFLGTLQTPISVDVTVPYALTTTAEDVIEALNTYMLGTPGFIAGELFGTGGQSYPSHISSLHIASFTRNFLNLPNPYFLAHTDPVTYGTNVFSFGSMNLGQLATAINSWSAAGYHRITNASSLFYPTLACSALENGNYHVSNTGATGVLTIQGDSIVNTTVPYTLGTQTISALATQINTQWTGVVQATPVGPHGGVATSNLLVTASPAVRVFTNSSLALQAHVQNLFLIELPIGVNTTAQQLVNWINTNCNSRNVTATLLASPQRTTNYLDEFGLPSGTNINGTTQVFTGEVPFEPPLGIPSHNVILYFNVRFATGGNPNEVAGIQVAFGGYESEGVFFPITAPNQFLEPVYNTLFPIQFTAHDADVVYILVRTRQNLEGTEYSSSGTYGTSSQYELNYSAMAEFSNGYPNEMLIPFVPADATRVAAWNDPTAFTPGGVPTVIAVPTRSNTIELTIEDVGISPPDSVHLTIINAPSALDEFAFLAVNRTNQGNSQTESREARVYGLVLDNRGAWDVLIGPEAHLVKAQTGSFSHLASSYVRTILDDDEGYDFEFFDPDGLPSEILSAISLSPVANYPQVWVLRIEPGVKQYLRSLRESAPTGSNDGCSINVDMLVTGRSTGVQGVARVTIFYDYTCVYDIGLCDFFWNLQDPPEPPGPEIIQNQLQIIYQPLIDCENLNSSGSSGENIELDVVWLTRIHNIPTFVNGNALLLMKSHYTSEVQSFFMPTVAQLQNLRFAVEDPSTGECPLLSSDIELMRFLNREVLVIRQGQSETYITDPNEIRARILTESSYLYIRPAFQFPPVDRIKDCGVDEIVIVGMGFRFKNWKNGLRNYAVVTGAHLILPNQIFSPPDIDICFRYYYNQHES